MSGAGGHYQCDLVVGVELRPAAPVLAETAAARLRAPAVQQRLAECPVLHFLAVTIFHRHRLDPLLVIEAHGDGQRRHLAAALAHAIGPELLDLAAFAAPGADGVKPPASTGALAAWLMANRLRLLARHQGHRAHSLARIREDARRASEARREAPGLAARIAATGATAQQELHRALRTRLGSPRRRLRLSLFAPVDEWHDLLGHALLTLAALAVALLASLAALRLGADLLGILGPGWAITAEAALREAFPRAMRHGWTAALALGGLAAGAGLAWRLLVRREARECEWTAPATTPEREARLLASEVDADGLCRQNHLASLVELKPGVLRGLLLRAKFALLRAYNLRFGATGHLGQMRTVHFGGWYLAPGGGGLVFLSNYDGSFASYLDDFIEKAAIGLTLAWSDGVGFPRARGLLRGGAASGRQFKPYARSSQALTLAHYRAYPDLSCDMVWRNGELVAGLRRPGLSPGEAGQWARLL